jgi:hypothetical protein
MSLGTFPVKKKHVDFDVTDRRMSVSAVSTLFLWTEKVQYISIVLPNKIPGNWYWRPVD